MNDVLTKKLEELRDSYLNQPARNAAAEEAEALRAALFALGEPQPQATSHEVSEFGPIATAVIDGFTLTRSHGRLYLVQRESRALEELPPSLVLEVLAVRDPADYDAPKVLPQTQKPSDP